MSYSFVQTQDGNFCGEVQKTEQAIVGYRNRICSDVCCDWSKLLQNLTDIQENFPAEIRCKWHEGSVLEHKFWCILISLKANLRFTTTN